MNPSGFIISKVAVAGRSMPDATLTFSPGLNVVSGASNTGKTYGWQLIDFMLGASKPPKAIPLAAGYSQALIELQSRNGIAMTLVRALGGGDAMLYPALMDNISSITSPSQLGAVHDRNDPNTISGLLLGLTGLMNKEIRKNEYGVKRTLSFRDVAWLTLVDEERIITERSPVLSGEYTTPTEERSAFGLFITGTDDAAILTQERPKDRKQRLELQMSFLQGLREDREARLNTYGVQMDQLPAQRERLSQAVASATELLATQQTELDSIAQRRDQAWSELQTLESHRLFISEQIKRLTLLKDHYTSDAARLESTLEAGELLERLPQGECPVCGHIVDDADATDATETQLREFQSASKAELAKIAILSRDLDASLVALNSESSQVGVEQERLRATLVKSNALIDDLLKRKVKTADEQLSQLLARQARLSEAAFIANEVADLRARYAVVESQSKQRTSRPKLGKKVEAAGMTEYCRVVEQTLRAWKFPFNGNVSWSDDNFDLVIGSENRGGMGKGFRAVTHAAFTVSLMRYCRAKGLPHPGIVILDTPLNPYKGADKNAENAATKEEVVNMEVQEAFYTDLAADASGDQIIVFENTEPPQSVRGRMRYTHFSGNLSNPPAGFFPIQPIAK